MSHKIYWKDIRQSFSSSKGRFLSIFSLMMIGAVTLVGLKITVPDIQKTAQSYIAQHHVMDLSVMASYGLDDADVEELNSIENADVEYGYLTDATVKNTDQAIRIFSTPKTISTVELVSGTLPNTQDEIALAESMTKDYKVGDTISFAEKDGQDVLVEHTFTITGFVNSSEIWNDTNMGISTVGSGSLSGYAITSEKAFSSDVYTIARLRYDDLKNVSYYSSTYTKRLQQHQEDLETLLEDNGDARLSSLKSSLQADIEQGKASLSEKQNQLSDAANQISQQEALLAASGVSTDSEAAKALAAAKESYNTQKTTADTEIATAQEQLTVAQERVDQLTTPAYTTYTRSNLPGGEGYTTYKSSSSSISAIGNIFPIVLYAVAAMVTFTTMTRFVDEERINAGIFKALGYTERQILTKFVIYGLVSSMLGTVVGILLGQFYLSPRIASIITNNTVIGTVNDYFYPGYIILAILLGLLSAVLPAYLVAKKELIEKPAQLLLPKPPVSGSKIFLERITFLWKRLSFTHKVTARNIFRYKQRMLMTIFGVAGSVALLFAGLGIRSSIFGVSDSQFSNILKYDMVVSPVSNISNSENESLQALLNSNKVDSSLFVNFEASRQKIDGIKEEQTVSIFVANASKLSDFVHLKSRSTQDSIVLDNQGVVLSEKLANLYQVKAGDSIRLTLNDKDYTVKVVAVTEMYAGHFVYMSDTYYQKITHQTVTNNAYLVRLKERTTENITAISSDFLDLSAVSGVVQNTSLINQLNTVSKSLQSVMLILVVLSILLGIVILYNLTNINVAERIRELSTIKVLGFHNKEVALYIYRETIVLSIIGIGVGLLGGYSLHRFLLEKIGSDVMMFNPSVSIEVYLIPILAIILILIVLGWWVNHTLKTVDMLEALKSVD